VALCHVKFLVLIISIDDRLTGSENCTMKVKDKTRITGAGMRFMKLTVIYNRKGYERNKDTLNEPRTGPILDRISKQKPN